ncbi:MAG: hypothetical protein AAFV29_21270, partial [Myxococcota bacterium]
MVGAFRGAGGVASSDVFFVFERDSSARRSFADRRSSAALVSSSASPLAFSRPPAFERDASSTVFEPLSCSAPEPAAAFALVFAPAEAEPPDEVAGSALLDLTEPEESLSEAFDLSESFKAAFDPEAVGASPDADELGLVGPSPAGEPGAVGF